MKIAKQTALFFGVIVILWAGLLPGLASEQYTFKWFAPWYTVLVDDTQGAYITKNNYLYYLDYEDLTTILVCSKLECLHDKEKNVFDCDAYVEHASIGILDERLYFQGTYFSNFQYEEAIFSCEKDGRNHQLQGLVDQLEEGVVYSDHGIKNGYYFFETERYFNELNEEVEFVEDSTLGVKNTMFCLDLRKNNSKSNKIETWDSSREHIRLEQVFENQLYYTHTGQEGSSSFWKYDLQTCEKEKMMDMEKNYNYIIVDGEVYMLSIEEGIFYYDGETQLLKTLFAFTKDEDKGRTYTDGDFFYIVSKIYEGTPSAKEMIVLNMDGRVENRISMPDEMVLIGCSKEYIFLEDTAQELYVVRKADFSSPNPEFVFIEFDVRGW